MRRYGWIMAVCFFLGSMLHAEVMIEQVDLRGSLSAEELSFSMNFDVDVDASPSRILLLKGDVLPTDYTLPRGAELVREGENYYLVFDKKGQQSVSVDFSAKVLSSGQDREALFYIPDALIRRLTLTPERSDYDIHVNSAALMEQTDGSDFETYLPATGIVQLLWTPKVEKLEGDLVASCDATFVGTAKVGSFQVQGNYRYTIPQGRLKKVSMKVPEGLSIIQVSGADLLAWDIKGSASSQVLEVELNRPQEDAYELTVQGEQTLPAFPCSFTFPVIEPLDVIRANGVVSVGTDSTIKLVVNEQGGLTQIEPSAVDWGKLEAPKRGVFAYMFANMPFTMELDADHIVTALHVEEQMVLALSENDLSLDVKLDLEVRDAPAREVKLSVSPEWTVTGVVGRNVVDYDVSDREGTRWIKVYFRKPVDSRTLVDVRLEKRIEEDAASFGLPTINVVDARSERGFLVLRSETGTRVQASELDGLREVNTGSLPIRIADARQAFRFKQSGWSGKVLVFQESPSIHAESFHLVSMGETGLFGSSLITYNVANAPTRELVLQIPAHYRNVELHGRDIRNWKQDGEQWLINLQQKVLGDYTLLVTYDHPATYQGEVLSCGAIQPMNIENESGYIALAGLPNLSLEAEVERSPSILPIDVDEIPEEYALLVNDPIMHAYKYVAAPHEAKVQIKRYRTQPLLTQVADHCSLETSFTKEGEAVTRAVYQVKNTDQQYLPIRLPSGAVLWSVMVNDAKVQVLDKGDGQMLVPVERRRDPNAPQVVAVTYAERMDELSWRTKTSFKAPMVHTEMVFARWNFKFPEGLYALKTAGNMESAEGQRGGVNCWAQFGRLIAPHQLFFGFLGVVIVALSIFCLGLFRAKGEATALPWIVSVFGAIYLLFAMLYLFAMFMSGAFDVSGNVLFTKAVTGSSDGLYVDLVLGSYHIILIKNIALVLIGLVPVLVALILRRTAWLSPLFVALVIAASFNSMLAILTIFIPVIYVMIAAYTLGQRKGMESLLRKEAAKQIFSEPFPEQDESTSAGFIRVKSLLFTFICSLLFSATASEIVVQNELVPAVNATEAKMDIKIPVFEGENVVNVAVKTELVFSLEKGERLQVLGADFIMTDYSASSDRLSVESTETGLFVRADRAGDYSASLEYTSMASYEHGQWSVPVWIPAALKNRAQVSLPSDEWTLATPNAIRVQQTGTQALVFFTPNERKGELIWKPKERKTDQEKTRFFCDLNTLADFRPGMISLLHTARFNIAQGELKNLKFDVPEGMNITEVNGNRVGTWRYDPEEGLLDVVLYEPAKESYELKIGAQIVQEKLPYKAELKGLSVRDAAMQRGVLACASGDAVQIDVLSFEELGNMNISDAARILSYDIENGIKRAFRYNRLPFLAVLAADEVVPELRLNERSSLDISRDQLRLTSRLDVAITKSGLFAMRIGIPEGFDMDSLTGQEVSHWDEVSGNTREVIVHFAKKITGNVSLNLVLSRSGRDLETQFSVPRIQMNGVLKHTGSLAITVERGIRLTAVSRDGVTEMNPRELQLRQEGCMAYRLLRPDWNVLLQSEVLAPKIEAEVLQRVDLSEGLLKVRCYIQYDIEYAGVREFRLKAPSPELALVISGRNIARIQKVDETNGIWQVELHNRVEKRYGLEVVYQQAFAHENKQLQIDPLHALGVESQKGYIALFSSGRVQVQPHNLSDRLRPEDARSIPVRFGAGDLSSAILCYRIMDRDIPLNLRVVRHNAAEVLAAQVHAVHLKSMITSSDQSLNHMEMTLDPGSLRFIEVWLPKRSEIWSVFVNQTAVRPLVSGEYYLIPIEEGEEQNATIEMIYAQATPPNHVAGKHYFEGPRFKLPLSDIEWTFFAPDNYIYSDFGGTVQASQPWPSERSVAWMSRDAKRFSSDLYSSYNRENAQRFEANAQQNISLGNELMTQGDQKGARKAFQKAIAYSQGQEALNEDARVQFRNLVRQQGVMGLANRRQQLKQSLNQLDDAPALPQESAQWSDDAIKKMEQQLGEKESSALSLLAEKMLEQQQAASSEVHPIRVVMPNEGTPIVFKRSLQLQTECEMSVEFKSTTSQGNYVAQMIAAGLAAATILLCGAYMRKV